MSGGRGNGGNGGNGGDRGMPEDNDVAAQAASARQYDWRPRPDPTVLTTQQLRETESSLNRNINERVAGLRELLESRLTAMDRATELLAATVDKIPAGAVKDLVRAREDADARVTAIRALIESRLDGMDKAAELLAATVGKVPSETDKAIYALRDLLGSRIDGMDTATKLLADNISKFPSEVDRAVGGLKEVLNGEILRVSAVTLEKFNAVDALFASNATALTAALAAQEKAVAEQNKSNTLAIDKSEQATKETIAANANQTSTGLAGLGTVMDDLKARVVRLEASVQNSRISSEDSLAVNTFGQTAEQNRVVQARTNIQLAIAGVSALIAIVAILFAVLKK